MRVTECYDLKHNLFSSSPVYLCSHRAKKRRTRLIAMKTKKILVVEDSVFTCFHLVSLLRQKGFENIRYCHSGEEAVAVFEDTRPNIVLLDIDLSGSMSGLDVARMIRTTSSAPIVFISARTDQHALELISAIKAYFIPKPFSDQLLSEVVYRALSPETCG